MTVLVDTSVWSLSFRRVSQPIHSPVARELERLIRDDDPVLLDGVRQELLSGVRTKARFEELRAVLRTFNSWDLSMHDYELAAEFANRCRSAGVQGSAVDFLLCSVGFRSDLAIFSSDRDFDGFARVLPIRLHTFR